MDPKWSHSHVVYKRSKIARMIMYHIKDVTVSDVLLAKRTGNRAILRVLKKTGRMPPMPAEDMEDMEDTEEMDVSE